uniref:WW domain-containing protein n=1 Tax=Monopterus albus TaxID=43700 RepID=A0A3Q3K6Y3_MONAL
LAPPFPEEADSRPLPPGWTSYLSPEGLRYYVNSCSKEKTWQRPFLSAEAPQRPLTCQNSSPYGTVTLNLYVLCSIFWTQFCFDKSPELEKLEVERIEWIQQHLRQYTTLRHETDMFNQSTVEPVDQLLQNVDPAKDRELWVKENKTGEVRPVDMDI